MQLGASASYFNSRVGSAPIHVAAQSAYVDIIKLLLKNSHNRADINIPNREGLTAFHLLLGKLVDLTGLENKSVQARGPKVPPKTSHKLRKQMGYFCLLLNMIVSRLIFPIYDEMPNLNYIHPKTLDITSRQKLYHIFMLRQP